MQRIVLKKLIVVSTSEEKSLEIPFSEGLNIILGGNKTGKSSIIKSIFTTLGCEVKKVEKDWKNLISSQILEFDYNDHSFCIHRQGDQYSLFKITPEGYECITSVGKGSFHEYSNALMDIFKIKLPCIITNSGAEVNIPPALLFRFQYIDQDDGWNSIATAFRNQSYIKNWKPNTNKLVSGYLETNYYELEAKKQRLLMEQDEKKGVLNTNQLFVNRISESIAQVVSDEDISQIENNISNDIEQIDSLRKDVFDLSQVISDLQNEIFIKEQNLHIVLKQLDELRKDADFAMTQDVEIICPVCGRAYSNTILDQFDISCDYATAEKSRDELVSSLAEDKEFLQKSKELYSQKKKELEAIEKRVRMSRELITYSNYYRTQGQSQMYHECQKELDKQQQEVDALTLQISSVDTDINNLKSAKRSKKIRDDIIEKCQYIANKINISSSFIKLRDFVQVIEKTGSETPRIVYMYQSALYLYNLNRENNIFSFFVIDTPNQQGQDETNLADLFSSMEVFLSKKGQVIVGTERETGFESVAANVIRLKEKRKCLNTQNYVKHTELVKALLESAQKN